jgi:flagellar assembly protein FliH
LHNVIKKENTQYVRGLKSYFIEDFSIALRGMNASAAQEGEETAPVDSAQEREDRAYEKGVQEGMREGEKRAAASYSRAVELMAKMSGELKNAQESFITRAEEDMVALSLAIARQIIRQEVKTNPDIIKSVVKEAIAQLIDKEGATIRVNPQDFEVLTAAESEMGISFQGKDRYKILADDFISAGGCIIESKTGIVDADLDTQFDEIWRRLLNTGD